ncbi:hypothetical protein O181_058990 [Austropuccinia psidii MF-1]|uniref:Uncharacterized protein n=1 Tax=Austropuccinia psidii MF-1 TaxID=1389203 RepID=A0A9Q3EHL4_9BASI|nr:hypothetical protein [Austropuccinia psidii MF-1]
MARGYSSLGQSSPCLLTHGIQTPNELTLPPFVEPSQHNEPPIPGLSPSSEPHEAEPKLSLTPPLTISNSSRYSSLSHNHQRYTCRLPPPPPSSPIPNPTPPVPSSSTPTPVPSPNSHNETWKQFTNLQLTVMIP